MAKKKSPEPTTMPSDLKDELDKLCEDFKAGGPDLDSIEREEAAKEFVIDYIAMMRGQKDLKPDERDAIWEGAVNRIKLWDPDDASVTYSAKLLRLLSDARDGRTMLFMKSLEAHRTNEERHKQSERGNTPKKKNVLTQFIAEAIRYRPELTLEELWSKMECATGEGLIYSVDSEAVEYWTGKGSETKIVPKQAVATRLSNQKKKRLIS